MQYAVIIEHAQGSYSAYSPDVPGCVAAAPTLEEVTRLMREALAFHFEDLQETGEPVPQATSLALMLEVEMPQAVPFPAR